jgi:hypothetical protein
MTPSLQAMKRQAMNQSLIHILFLTAPKGMSVLPQSAKYVNNYKEEEEI